MNLVVRAHALHASGQATGTVVLVGAALGATLLLMRPGWLGPALLLFGASFFLYGFHSYRPQSQAFELLVTVLALALLLPLARDAGAVTAPAPARQIVLPFLGLYILTATCSLLLLPSAVLEHRVFLEGSDIFGAILGAFPKDPLYPIASANRLWLFAIFGVLLVAQPDSRGLYRGLFRGIAWAAGVTVLLGLLDFAGVLSLARLNLSHLFYGGQYRRLQSTFGNPSWFACFVACALPFVLLEFRAARRFYAVALAAFFPLCAASLFLSGARASWLAGVILIVALSGVAVVARRQGRPLPAPGRLAWATLGATLATVAVLAAAAHWPAVLPDAAAGGASLERFEGLSREIRIRGLGLTSPRRVAAAYAIELAKQKPLLGLGYESFNMHLRAQLELPGSDVARLVNATAQNDAVETVFDDSHSTYLQVLVGTGVLGLVLWLMIGVSSVLVATRALVRSREPVTLCVLLGLLLFHFYGLFQGMAYIPVIFLLFPVLTCYAMTLDPGSLPAWLHRGHKGLLASLGLLVLASAFGYAADHGYRSVKHRFGLTAYIPDEAAEFEGFYRAESGPAGEFRWMPRRGIVNIRRVAPFRLSLTCEHPDLEREPVLVSLRFEGRDAGSLVCRRPGTQERRFDFGSVGALRLSVSRTFRPGGTDPRELGIAVSAIRWE
jgi:O-antigen ligase